MTTAALQDMFLPDNRCFGCGPANPDGIHLKTYERPDGDYVAEWTPEDRFQGPPGYVNGGVMAVPMDCHGTWAAMHRFSEERGGEPVHAVTAGYGVKLLAPTPVGVRVVLHARVLDTTRRHANVLVSAEVDGRRTAEFEGRYVCIDDYGDLDARD